MSELLKAINIKVDVLTNQVESLTTELALEKLENKNLRARLSKYEEPAKDSHNSSIPPSKESIKAQVLRRTNSLREKSNKPNGGQLGHTGSTLEISKCPDQIIEHQPAFCTHCGKDLSLIVGVVLDKCQSIDIPPVKPLITEHQTFMKKCTCGYCTSSCLPKHVSSAISYGINIRAIVSYLNSIQCLPYKRTCDILQDMFNLKISQGTIANILKKMKINSTGAYEQIRQKIESSAVVGADETGQNINGDLHWAWVWQTPNLTYIYQDKSRGRPAINKHFPNGLDKSILVTDRHASYFNMNVKSHQICLAHLLRELTYLGELQKTQSWSSCLLNLLREAIHAVKSIKWNEIDRDSIIKRFNDLINQSTTEMHRKIQALHKSLKKHKEHVFKFLFDPNVPPDNNASERAVRMIKVKQKVSGFFKTDQGADAFCQIHSIADTAKKNGSNAFVALTRVAENIESPAF